MFFQNLCSHLSNVFSSHLIQSQILNFENGKTLQNQGFLSSQVPGLNSCIVRVTGLLNLYLNFVSFSLKVRSTFIQKFSLGIRIQEQLQWVKLKIHLTTLFFIMTIDMCLGKSAQVVQLCRDTSVEQFPCLFSDVLRAY